MENYSVYKLTFPDGKVYIGQTGKEPEERWQDGKGYIGQQVYLAIKKCGWENIKKDILKNNLTKKEALKLESFYIKHYRSAEEDFGFNQTGGFLIPVPNQKTIFISSCENSLALFALKNLKGEHYKIWHYLTEIKNKTVFVLSSKEVCEMCDISRDTYDKAIKRFMTLGLMKEKNKSKNEYFIYY